MKNQSALSITEASEPYVEAWVKRQTPNSPIESAIDTTNLIEHSQEELGTLSDLAPGPGPVTVSESFSRRLRTLEESGGRTQLQFVKSENVTAICVRLPVRSARQRATALPFSVEEQIGASIESVFVIEAPRNKSEAEPDVVLAMIVAKNVVAELGAGLSSSCRLVPDIMAIPRPAATPLGKGWSVWRESGRDVVRVSDGTGFAFDSAMFAVLWNRAGRPAVNWLGGEPDVGLLTAEIPINDLRANPPDADPSDLLFSLRSADRFSLDTTVLRSIRAIAAVLCLGLAAHLTMGIIDLVALSRLAGQERASAQDALDTVLPDVDVSADPAQTLARLMPASNGRLRSDFLPLLTEVSDVLLTEGPTLSFRRLSFTSDGSVLTVRLMAGALDDLQRIETILLDEGFGVVSGAATAGDGGAEVELRIVRTPSGLNP